MHAPNHFPHTASEPHELAGRTLRYVLTLALVDAGREMTVQELADHLCAQGVRTPGRTSKVISDGLRWEAARGRVRRVGRGRYVAMPVPRQTLAWMRTRVETVLHRTTIA